MTRTLKIAIVALVVSLPLLMAPTGGFPSRPKFASMGIGAAAPTGSGVGLASGTGPRWDLNETDAAADNRRWQFAVNAEQFKIRTSNDALNSVVDALTIDRTGTSVDSVSIAPTSGSLTVSANLALLTGATGAEFRWSELDAAVDNKLWYATAAAETLGFGTRNDAGAFGAEFITVNRTGTAVDSINFAATAVTINSVPAATADSTTATVALTTGCTTTPNFDFRFAKAGNVVVISQTNTPTCTSNAVTTGITAAVPAAYRPAVNQCVAYIAATDNGAGTVAAVQVQTDGDINWGEGAGASCSALGWTSSGTKTIPPWSGSYVLN